MDEGTYTCQVCGEEIVVSVDPTGGSLQEYGEDCPVCCHPHWLTIHVGVDRSVLIAARAE
jgi:hypothetical protein